MFVLELKFADRLNPITRFMKLKAPLGKAVWRMYHSKGMTVCFLCVLSPAIIKATILTQDATYWSGWSCFIQMLIDCD